MIRLLADFLGGTAALTTITITYLRWKTRRRRETHQQNVARIERENAELDQEIDKITGH